MRAIQWRRRKLGWRATAVMAAILASAATGIAIPGLALAAPRPLRPLPPPGDYCAKVTIFGARGSGQAFDTSGPFRGEGPEVRKAITIIEGDLHAKGITYSDAGIFYPALSTSYLKPDLPLDGLDPLLYVKDHMDVFLRGISTGVAETVTYAEWAQQDCSNSKIILLGYSQGAMVIHQAELLLKTEDRAAYNLIIGTVLIADGDRHGNTKAAWFGSSNPNASGIQTWAANTLHSGTAYPDAPLPTTADICNANDLVCNFSAATITNFSAAAKVHTTSYANCNAKGQCSYGAALINAADWVGGEAAIKA